jgi:tetratricopeptide (TPR) repeat protein
VKRDDNSHPRLPAEFTSKVSLGEHTYLVLTESSGGRSTTITSRVYLGGEIILTRAYDYAVESPAPTFKQLDELMRQQHRLAIGALKSEREKQAKTPQQYLAEAKRLLQRKSHRKALGVLREGLEHHIDNPFLLSYCGCLAAIVEKEHERGVAACKRAIDILKARVPFGQEFFFPTFYLNLGRAYVAAGSKTSAVAAFQKGLSYDGGDRDLQEEMKTLGVRKKPAVPFLKRSHPINRYVGLLLHRLR